MPLVPPSVVLVLLASLALTARPDAQCQIDKLTPPDGGVSHGFGFSVAVSPGMIAVGAPRADGREFGTGAVYIYEWADAGWVETAKLYGDEGLYLDRLGHSVSLSGDILVAGAPERNKVYVFGNSAGGWTQAAILRRADPVGYDLFGGCVRHSGDTVVAGARMDSDKGQAAGAAYVFESTPTGWTQRAKLTASDASPYDWFGDFVDVSGDTILVGSVNDDDRGDSSGAVYVFERNAATWIQTAKLVPSDSAAGDHFGGTLDLDGDRAMIGAYDDDDLGGASGSVYVFERGGSGWSQIAKLLASDGKYYGRFGSAVALTGDKALIGASANEYQGDGIGQAYLFVRKPTGWTEVAKLAPRENVEDDLFGLALAFSGDRAAVGASRDDDLGPVSGSLHAFSLSGIGCPSLLGMPKLLPLRLGGVQTLHLDAGTAHAGRIHLVLGSATGTGPGFSYGGFHVPLYPDAYFGLTLTQPNVVPFTNTLGVLDAEGQGSARLTLPPLDPALVGTRLHHACLVFDAAHGLRFVSNPTPLTFVR